MKKANSQVGRQIHLPIGQAFRISLESVRIRFWRSVITAAGIFLGIAFLASVLAQNLVQWPTPDPRIGVGLVRLEGEITIPYDYDAWKPATVAEARAAGIPEEAINRVTTGGKVDIRMLAQSVERLERADRRLVLVRAKTAALDRLPKSLLQGPDDKMIRVQDLKDLKLGAPLIKELTNNTDIALKDFKAAVQKVYDAQKSIERLRRRLAVFRFDKKALERLEESKAYTLQEILAQAKMFTPKADIEGVKLVNTGGRGIALNMARDPDAAKKIYVKSRDLVWVPDASAKSRSKWLVIMSLIVCTIGITNSMLMSVTERFKEIGTMKCLGALNKFIVELFLLESGFLGLIASFAGWLVGVGIIMLLAAASKGWVIVSQVGLLDVLRLLGISLGIGMALTIIATIAPAIRAAAMPPAAALRVEI